MGPDGKPVLCPFCGADARSNMRVSKTQKGRPTLFCTACKTRIFFTTHTAYCGFLAACENTVEKWNAGNRVNERAAVIEQWGRDNGV